MLKQVIAILFFAAFLLQTFSKSLMIAGYYTNTASYAKNCENKAKPALHCNGRCQLMKKLKKEASKDQQNPERKAEKKEDVLSSQFFTCSISCYSLQVVTSYTVYTDHKLTDMPSAIFHPPAV